jgi:hypothetical protein
MLRLVLAAAVAALVLPATAANATYCGPVADPACRIVCQVTGYCPR